LDYNLLFRWFARMEMNGRAWDCAVFDKNRERLLNQEIAEATTQRVLKIAHLSGEHFTADGTLIEAWATQAAHLLRIPAGQCFPALAGLLWEFVSAPRIRCYASRAYCLT
jgi:hypothetical protein